VAKESIDREIGEIKGCLSVIRENVEKFSTDSSEIFKRLNAAEMATSKVQNWIENYEKQKDDSKDSVNTKIAIWGLIITAISALIALFVR
jgi:hypothetical protein